MKDNKLSWLKHKGYLHLTPQIDIIKRRTELISKVTNPKYVSTYAFYPLIHSVIKERKYKKTPDSLGRTHSYKNENGKYVATAKQRPLHYSSHMDALIFGYYASILQEKYEEELFKSDKLSECIIAYRKISTGIDDKNKSTIHFAKEVFDEIRSRSSEHCSVLMFDIKSFFSAIDHEVLKNAWKNLLNVIDLPADHENVFKASTRFSYILRDDLRIGVATNGRRKGFDEKKLASIRKTGQFCYFESPRDFRQAIKEGFLKVYRFPFTNQNKEPIGIPQGLAISAVLANLYLLNFDKKVYDFIVKQLNGFYRRYSDDILVICKPEEVETLRTFIIEAIEHSKVSISKDKTEEYYFRNLAIGKGENRLTSIKVRESYCQIGAPLTYLGFEFYGDKVLIKSSNLAKFYRRMKRSVKSKAKRAKSQSEKSPYNKLAIYRRQLYRLYTMYDLNTTTTRTTINKLIKNDRGFYELKIIKIDKTQKSNYLSYVQRASEIMNDKSIVNQIRNHRSIFNETIAKNLRKIKSTI